MTRLAAITDNATYDTTPEIRDTQADAFAADDEVSIWVEFGEETMDNENWRLSSGGTVVLEIVINILVRKRSGVAMMTQANNALQDVRNAINANPENWAALYASANFRGFDPCSTDEGSLSDEGMVLFSQPVGFTYQAGPTW